MTDEQIRVLYQALVAREFEATLSRLRGAGHEVTIRRLPFRATELTPEQAQIEVDGRIRCLTWDMKGWRWPTCEPETP